VNKATKKLSKSKPNVRTRTVKTRTKSANVAKRSAKSPVKSRSGRVAAKPASAKRAPKKATATTRAAKAAKTSTARARTIKRAAASASAKQRSRNAGKSEPLVRSAQQIWLAGLGALVSARKQGEQLLDTLVREGTELEQTARDLADTSLKRIGLSIDKTSNQVQSQGRHAWESLEAAFEQRVGEVLTRLGIPARQEMDALLRHIAELTEQVQKLKSASQTRFDRLVETGTRRTRDDLSDLARELEEVQLAAKQSMKQGIARARKAIKNASR